jgi:acyl-coenzyme A thioesterase PaaI-like protein
LTTDTVDLFRSADGKGLRPRLLANDAALLKLGKRLAVGEVSTCSAAGGDPAAHVTSTYSIPPKRD